VEMAGADVCCGGGGTFQWEHPEVASGISAKKVQSIKETGASIVASGCPGCRLQIVGNLTEDSIETIHPVELVARALL
jgi:glycolate oxidase iron-sulfur subunit